MADFPSEPAGPQPVDLLAAYAELHAAVLTATDVVEFLQRLSTLAASTVPGTSCGITLDAHPAAMTVVSSDHFALSLDEVQYGFRQGPCLHAMETNREVAVPDLVDDARWPLYRGRALHEGVRSSVSIPISIDAEQRRALGALNLYSTRPDTFGVAAVADVRAFTRQAGIALTLLTRHTRQLTLEQQLRDALATRAVIDQALGILMGQQRISATAAWDLLRKASSLANRKMGEIAAELIATTTGHPPLRPRPFADPR